MSGFLTRQAPTATPRNGPDEAYRWPKGETLPGEDGVPTRISRPLDFLAVTEVRFGIEMDPEVTRVLQERAYTSPIWYTP